MAPEAPERQGDLGHWLGDLSANLLCVVLTVLMLLALIPFRQAAQDDGSSEHVAYAARPLAGAALVEMLHRRALEQPGTLDLLAGGVRGPGGMPQGAASLPLPEAAVIDLFIFDQRHHAGLVTRLDARGTARREISVPEALRTADGLDWSRAFLALGRDAPDRAAFTQGLTDLLIGGGTGALGPEDAAEGTGGRIGASLIDRLRQWQTWTNAVLGILTGLLLWGLSRRGRRRYMPRR